MRGGLRKRGRGREGESEREREGVGGRQGASPRREGCDPRWWEEGKGAMVGHGSVRGARGGRMAVISATGTRKRILDGTLPRSTFAGTPTLLPFSLLFPRCLPPTTIGHHRSHPTAPPVRLFLFRGCEHDASYPRSATQPGGTPALCSSPCISTYESFAGGSEPR